MAKPLTYIETYLASEGFLAYQDRQFAKGMHLSLNDHIFLSSYLLMIRILMEKGMLLMMQKC
ncbi:hypothetical protein [Paraflavitalea speifideaquila]|uniref:hypothetical protein n=1 Tax=Paraflavitalea speifideaquila TaxID=3076558 RepID=UPI0028E266EB|nr:hypothetical protein [Paraflavitalea speifideiaquila]